jgi:hypothetical protein
MIEYFVFLSEIVIQFKDRGYITTSKKVIQIDSHSNVDESVETVPITIIRRAPYSYNQVVKHEFVPLHSKLVCTRNEVDSVVMCESLCDVATKQIPCPSGRKSPAGDIYKLGSALGSDQERSVVLKMDSECLRQKGKTKGRRTVWV